MTQALLAKSQEPLIRLRPCPRVNVILPIDESIIFTAIRQCLETAEHYIRQGNRRDAEFYLDTADAYANRVIFCRQMIITTQRQEAPDH